jgi:hypothetical protein
MRSIVSGLMAGLTALTLAQPVQAQVAWDAPLLVSPGSPTGWGIYLVDPWPGSGIGALATWRAGGPIGFRLGVAEGWRGDLAVYGGIDMSGPLARHSSEFPLDVDWVTGAGVSVGESALISFPLGLSMGRVIRADGATFNPYFAPRARLDAWLGDPRPRRGARLNLGVDLGVDLSFQPGWAIRFGATLGDPDAIAIGISSSLR